MAFEGIPQAAIQFFEGLEADNSKSYWQDNKSTFQTAVREPVLALCEELGEFGPFHLFRPHNDLRFAKNKPPYKTHQGAYGESEGGAGHYLDVSASGLMCGTGYYAMANDQLQRFREAVDRESTGAEIAAIVADLSRSFSIGAMEQLKTAPRGFSKDHPRLALLQRKGLMASKSFGAPAWLHTKKAAAKIRDVWNAAGPMNVWLDTHVGPSTIQPEGFLR